MSEGYSQPIYVSSFPYHSGFLNVPQPTGASGGVGIWYAYFENTDLANDGQPKVISLSGIGTSGNGELFASVTNGVKFEVNAVVQATAWGMIPATGRSQREIASYSLEDEGKWLGLQLDKQGTLLTRAHSAFHQRAANITYGGVLVVGDIVRAVGANTSSTLDSVREGWISVIATPL